MRFAPVMNILVLETTVLKHVLKLQPHTHTASYERLSNRTYLETIAHRYLPEADLGFEKGGGGVQWQNFKK